ncbi:MAG: hypothetical protein GEEBNDBF_00707 [bacterium]|nr:hypothetical protein [bacterium]
MRDCWYPVSLLLPLLLLACSAAGPSAPQTELDPAATAVPQVWQPADDLQVFLPGYYELAWQPSGEVATSWLPTRGLQQTDDLYDLSVAPFFTKQMLQAVRVDRQPQEVRVSFRVTHPFAAPTSLDAPPSGRNRADLGIAARLLVLLDANPATDGYFAPPNRVIAQTGLISNADGYWAPRGILAPPQPLSATAFPYKLVVDEMLDNRLAHSNGGQVTGNYDPVEGWTRATMGPDLAGWTGYGVLHQGQAAEVTIAFDAVQLQASGYAPVLLAPVALYNDPRGGATGLQKRGNRLPPATPDWTRFAYRMPHGALDVESVRLLATPDPLLASTISATTLHLRVTDWDARATASTATDLSDEPVLSLVQAQEVGLPALEAVIPALGISETLLTCQDDDTLFGGDLATDSGLPSDPLYYTGILTNPGLAGQQVGTVWGMVRAVDVEADQAWNDGWRFALDPGLAPLTSDRPEPITYQAFAVAVESGNLPPVPTLLSTPPTIPNGSSTTVTLGMLTDPENDPVVVSIDWDNDGSFTVVDTLTWSSGYPVPVTWDSTPYTYTWTGTAADNRTIPVRFFDGYNTVTVNLTTQVIRCVPDNFTTSISWTFPGFWPYYTIAASSDIPPADMAALRLPGASGGVLYAGFETGKFDLYRSHLPTPGPGINEQVTNFTGFGSKAGAQVEIDSTNRVLFSMRGAGESRLGPPSALYPAGSGVEANIYWFDYVAGSPATTYNVISTGGNRVLAMTLDGDDNVYYIDTNHHLHRLVKTSSPTPYAEDTTAPYPIDLTSASYSGGITVAGATPAERRKIHDFILDWRSGAFFILAQSEETPTALVKNGYVYRINCDGGFPATVAGNPNPLPLWLTDSNVQDRKADITIDQLDANGATLAGDAGSSQILVSGYIQVVAGAPEMHFLDTNLSVLAERHVDYNGAAPVAINTSNMISSGFIYWWLSYVDYTDTIGIRSTPIPGWQ